MSSFTCPLPIATTDKVLLGHGSGGTLSAALLRDVFLPAFGNPLLDRLEDQAVLKAPAGRLAITTDSFVVKPLFFPGGDIGSLAVHGTINDLAVGGAQPLALTAAFILEEGLPIAELRRVVESMALAAAAVKTPIVTGDTKVVERGSGDGIFISMTGIGVVAERTQLSASNARPGDLVILSGAIGDHGMTILTQREGLELAGAIASDSAPLDSLVRCMLDVTRDVRAMRDPTRGGLASTLNEIAGQSKVGIEIRETAIPVHAAVRGACEVLGLDPLYVANEGKLVAIVPAVSADAILTAMRQHPLGREAAIIGAVVERHPGLVTMRTPYGTSRVVDMLAGDQLPRIC